MEGNRNRIDWNGLESEWIGIGMELRRERNGMEWNGIEWNGMEWNGMDWNGMHWNGIRMESEWNGTEWNQNGMELE
jgi:hypothetical protein